MIEISIISIVMYQFFVGAMPRRETMGKIATGRRSYRDKISYNN